MDEPEWPGLRGRNTDSDARSSAAGCPGARGEMRHVAESDYVIINDEIDAALTICKRSDTPPVCVSAPSAPVAS